MQIEQEHDIEMLRQVALLLEKENQRLHERLRVLVAELDTLKGADAGRLQFEIELLQQALARQRQALFGESSERRPQTQTEESVPHAATPRHGHGPRLQPRLPLIESIHELPETERDCPVCGGRLAEMTGQFEEADEISVVQRRFVVVQHRRRKYRCRCNAAVVTAPAPPKLQPGGHYSIEFAVEVAVGKYSDHLPLERQRRIMDREGLTVDSQTLWDQIEALAQLLEPSYRALRPEVLASPLVHADETHWRLMGKGEVTSRWWAWATASEDAICYEILPHRSQSAAKAVLGDYDGTVVADGYGAYGALRKDGSRFRLVHCWAHVRRKFVQAAPHYPAECETVLDLIGKLYEIESEVPRAGPGENGAEARLALRAKLRDERSREIIKNIHDWALTVGGLPQSSFGRAVRYMLGLWPGLVAFLDDPKIPLDNNAIERGLRGLVLGRKNHYGSRSRRGTEVAAIFYSLIETAKLRGVEPRSYLLRAAHAALKTPPAVLLPELTRA
jgi:transposase